MQAHLEHGQLPWWNHLQKMNKDGQVKHIMAGQIANQQRQKKAITIWVNKINFERK